MSIPWNKGLVGVQVAWNKGKLFSKESRNKMSEAKKGKEPWNKGLKGAQEAWNKGRPLGFIPKCAFKKGLVPWNFQNKRPLNKKIRESFKYRQWRSDIFTRDNFTCQECWVRGVRLNAHHKEPFYKIMDEYNIKTLEQALDCEKFWNINNGVTLCEPCHDKTKPGRIKRIIIIEAQVPAQK